MGGVFRNVTAPAKIAMVNNKLGNPSLKFNQGSSYEVYDMVDVTSTIGTQQTIRFFENVNAKAWPLTNIQQNQLQVGEALAIEYIAFTRVAKKKPATPTDPEEWCTQQALVNVSGLSLSQFSFLLDNSRIIKNNSLTRTNSIFNPKGDTGTNNLFFPDTDLVIPPQISFTAELTVPINCDALNPDTEVAVYYGCHIFGSAAILNLKSNV